MNKCPKCGLYMTSHMKYIFGGARLVWTCSCGYSTEQCDTGMTYSDRNKTTGENYGKKQFAESKSSKSEQ